MTDWNAVSAFMAAVVPWPSSPQDDGWVVMPNGYPDKKTTTGRLPTGKYPIGNGRAFKTVDEFVNFAGWAKKLTGKTSITVGSVGLTGEFVASYGGEGSKPASLDELMRRLAKDGCALLVISSELPEVLALCDRIGIMRGGRLVNTFDDCSELNEDLLMKYASGEVVLS